MVAQLPTAMEPAPHEGPMRGAGAPTPAGTKVFLTLLRKAQPMLAEASLAAIANQYSCQIAMCKNTEEIGAVVRRIEASNAFKQQLQKWKNKSPCVRNPEHDSRAELEPFQRWRSSDESKSSPASGGPGTWASAW